MNLNRKTTAIAILVSLIVLVPIVYAFSDPPIVVPRGMVTICFDDGWSTTYTTAYPQMQAYGYAGDIDVITYSVGEPWGPALPSGQSVGYASWSQIQTLVNSGWDAVSHSVTHPDFNNLSEASIVYQLQASQQQLLGNLTGNEGYRFWCQPYDDYDPANYSQLVSQYYDMACLSETYGDQMVNPPLQYNIDRYCIENTTTLNQIEDEINDAVSNNIWLMLIVHIITPSNPTADTYMLNSTFASMLAYLHDQKVPVVTASYVYDNFVASATAPTPTAASTPTPTPTSTSSGGMTAQQWADFYQWSTNGSALQTYKNLKGIG